MEFQGRQFLQLGKRPMAFVVVAALAALVLASAGPAQAKRIVGTKGPDRIVGTAQADVIRSLGGNDRIRGRGGRDRLSAGRGRDRLVGGRGADRLNAVDGRRDRVVNGGPGTDVCRVDAADQASIKGCETVKVGRPGGPGGPGAGPTCASPPEEAKLAAGALARAAQEQAPPTFSEPFYAITITINASVDGLNGDELPISIEAVCNVPANLESEAAQLIGGDGIALISPDTQVFDAAGQQLTGDAATTALAGADTVTLKAQLQRPPTWRQDEDGQPVPTFTTSRADITD
jgi:Ca2+-binding RTX toxin-like protein